MCSVMVVCVLYPRFELLAGLGDRRALLAEPVALAPEAGREQVVGEVSAAAEAFGVVRGMRLGEAMSRCPALRLIPPDPEGVRSLWNGVLDRLERIGAEVESDQAGAAYFESAGLHGLHGGALAGVLAEARRALGPGARFGAAPSRFAAHAAALQARPRRGRRAQVVEESAVLDFLAPLPVGLLRTRLELQALPEVLERLGIRTLGEVAALPSRAVAERFGHPGLLAHDLARGADLPLVPRRPPEPVFERLDLPDAASGQQLERALELLVARLLARRERRGRTLRGLAVSARFVAGGTWRARSPCATRARTPSGSSSCCGPSWPSCRRRPSRSRSRSRRSARRRRTRGVLDEAATVRRAAWARPFARPARRPARRRPEGARGRPASRIPERRAVLAPFPDPPAP